ncbi:hypothetical protein Tmar_0043 [Thermaerobacter marianensis DSM 12885]|uniref:Phage protein, HK97 gp10 family n=1 Tax=Thermaerobacter marianensis (strain ATCC 700841 / DSM 12885 / JCM 10246 / 7p75a) TaxID=644966 RepID=E6SKI1_THEM7|nr:hypothetical protein [Thermaerobacter marianensis]ADU50168.1 hypothetical protein Tmar_0043 [Thermaerobacter marianensis DSM 12885]
MAKVVTKWYLGEFMRAAQAHVVRGMTKAVLYCEGVAKQKVSRGNVDGKNPSKPGEPPKTVTGTLRANIGHDVAVTPSEVIGMIGVRKGPANKYARRLELGFHGTVKVKAHTRTQTHAWGRPLKTPKKVRVRAYSYTVNQAPRPYLRPTVAENKEQILKLIAKG